MDTDRPELPFTRKQFAEVRPFVLAAAQSTLPLSVSAQIHKQPAAKDLGFVPFSPLPPGEQPPSMSENWRYAMRRYGRFQARGRGQ